MWRGRRLACSFCGKGEQDVAKLVAGPRVFICDRCVAIASRIMADADGGQAPRPQGLLRRVWTRLGRALGRGAGRTSECHVTV